MAEHHADGRFLPSPLWSGCPKISPNIHHERQILHRPPLAQSLLNAAQFDHLLFGNRDLVAGWCLDATTKRPDNPAARLPSTTFDVLVAQKFNSTDHP